MRHLFVTNDFPPKIGGTESYLVNLCSGFDPSDIAVVAPAREGHEAVDAQLPFSVVRLEGTYLRASGEVRDQIVTAAKDRGVHAVHFLQTLPLGRLASEVRERTSLPVTIVAHGNEVIAPARAPVVKRVLRRTLISADLVLAVSEHTKSRVEAITGRRARVVLMPPTVDVHRFSLRVTGHRVRERLGLGSEFVVLFVNRLVKRKGAETLLRAMTQVPGIAIIVGTGPEERSLRRISDELELGRRVIFAGSVPDADLPEYYAAADVFCMPGATRLGGLDAEGFGVVFLEAAATGLPAIAGRSGGAGEAVLDGVTGIVLEQSSPPTVAEALRELQADEVLRVMLGAAGRERALTGFAPDVRASQLESQLVTATGAGSRTGA